MKKVLFLLTFILSGIGMATAQTSQISGVVYSEADGEPVIGASVLVVGTDLGAATDIEGKFVIADVPASATTLRVSYMGMATQEVKILRGKTIKVTLTEDGVALDDVMVVANGSWDESGTRKFQMSFTARFEQAEVILDSQGLTVYPNEGEPYAPELSGKNRMAEEIRLLATIIADPTVKNEANPPESACKTVRLIEALRESAAQNGAIITL